jgi:hypothetical protein
MKHNVTLVMLVILMLGITFSAQAQYRNQRPGQGREFRQQERKQVSPEKRAEMMAKHLELSAEEKAKVQALFEEQDMKRKQRMEEMKQKREELKAKLETERNANQAELISIIGNEKFQQMQSKRIQHLEKELRKMKMREHRRTYQASGNQSPQQRWRERRFQSPRPANR